MPRILIQHRRDTVENWKNINPVLADGEIGFVTGSNPILFKIGDGNTQWNSLAAASSPVGIPGDKGAKGDKGDQGATGVQGSKGDKGDKGDIGNPTPYSLQEKRFTRSGTFIVPVTGFYEVTISGAGAWPPDQTYKNISNEYLWVCPSIGGHGAVGRALLLLTAGESYPVVVGKAKKGEDGEATYFGTPTMLYAEGARAVRDSMEGLPPEMQVRPFSADVLEKPSYSATQVVGAEELFVFPAQPPVRLFAVAIGAVPAQSPFLPPRYGQGGAYQAARVAAGKTVKVDCWNMAGGIVILRWVGTLEEGDQ